jgi:protein-S-isoprenylcysteine O-methyltransferase Ste14
MNQTDGAPHDRGASSRFVWPPAIYGSALAASALLTWFWPLPELPGAGTVALRLLGLATVVLGLGFVLAAGRLFKRAGTPVAPIRPTTALVTGGVYGWTRNPMYLGLSLILLGLTLASGSAWFLLGLGLAVLAVTKLAIEKEETYLAGKFGRSYLDYKARVRRWI